MITTRISPSLLAAALCLIPLISARGQSIVTAPTAPATDILSSNGSGGTFTRLIDEDANSNHARGQLFSLGDGPGTAYEISAVTIKKDNNQTYNNGTITLRLFEGNQSDWDAGTGHSTGTDGNNYLVDSTVTLLHTEAFNLNGTFSDNDYVTFQLASPVQVNESSDFGFFLVYDQAVGDDDDFEHLEGGAGGRISITTTNHGTSGSRNVVYFVQGTAVSPSGTITTSATAPSTDIISSSATGSTDTSLFDEGANANHARGQLFNLPNGSGTSYEISAITVRKSIDQTFSDDSLTLRIFEGTQSQWDAGTGHDTLTDGSDYYVGTSVSPLYTESFDLNATFTNNDYITFELATPITVNEDSDFGFFMTYDQGGGSETAFRHREHTSGAGRISIDTSTHTTSGSRKVVYFVEGTAIGTPPSSLSLASPFQERMVLQRGKPVNIWGQADPSTAVSVTIDGETANGTSEPDGSWKLTLPTLNPGGPHTLTVTSGSDSIVLNDVLIGDVWLCFGQSNMVWSLNSTGASWHTAYETAIEANDNIRCLKVTQFGALTAQEKSTVPGGHYVSGGMNWLDKSDVGPWSAVGSVFSYQMHQATGVPTAFIWAAWGSSSIEGWMPSELAPDLPHFAELLPDYYQVNDAGNVESYATNNGFATNTEALTSLFTNGWSGATSSHDIFVRTRSNVIYNQMIHPLRDFGISGFVWYQGEANAGPIETVAEYGFSLPAMITEYRSRFGQGDLPFLGVQLPSYNSTNWPWFRESQSRMETLPNAYVATTIDTGLSGNIHPPDKEPIGIRLSLLARKYALGESIEAHGPTFDSMSVSGNEATITFTNATGMNTNVSAGLFQISDTGTPETFVNANAVSVSGNEVTISAPGVTTPAEVRYAWIPVPNAFTTLENGSGIPASPFRTDSFELPGLGAQAPQSIDDAYEVAQNTVLNVPAVGILANDIDLNQDVLTANLITDVSDGILSLQPDGSFTYTPHGGFAGTDSFTYDCSDGGLTSASATVTITVAGTQSGYYTWRTGISWGSGDDETETGDPDLDGIENFLEYALGLDPLTSDPSGLPTLTPNGSDSEYDFNNLRDDVLYEVLLSTDLVNWSEPAFAEVTSATMMPVLIPGSEAVDGRLFVRLRVSEQ
ncbi:sialate O-acetylesterase [Haloferula sp.]|uniref:sialate O-acetylesterase n=1 Tax=Haloferula sp. TaxID=2497595 RepID=UPI00329C24C4